MPERVYIETTFVSYLTARASRDVVVTGINRVPKSGGTIVAETINFAFRNLFFKKLERVIRRRRKNASTF